jgi:hypothetical protein
MLGSRLVHKHPRAIVHVAGAVLTFQMSRQVTVSFPSAADAFSSMSAGRPALSTAGKTSSVAGRSAPG